MKNRLVVLGLVLVCLLSSAFLSCGGDQSDEDEPNEDRTSKEKLAGTYTLVEIEVENVGTTITIRIPNISGTLHLKLEGSWFMNMVVPEIGLSQNIDGTHWEADQKTITTGNVDQTTQTGYTLDGKDLTFSVAADDLRVQTTWRRF